MSKEYICKCNKCGNALLDENPQTDAIKRAINGKELEMVQIPEKCDNGETVYSWACPTCMTDDYLMDIE